MSPGHTTYVDHLAEVPMFSGCSKKELNSVGRLAEEVSVETGYRIVSEGDFGHEFYVILDGEAKVTRNGRKVADLSAGSSFGELALLVKEPRNATVTANSPMTLLVIGQREFNGILDEIPSISRKLLVTMAQRLRQADSRAVH